MKENASFSYEKKGSFDHRHIRKQIYDLECYFMYLFLSLCLRAKLGKIRKKQRTVMLMRFFRSLIKRFCSFRSVKVAILYIWMLDKHGRNKRALSFKREKEKKNWNFHKICEFYWAKQTMAFWAIRLDFNICIFHLHFPYVKALILFCFVLFVCNLRFVTVQSMLTKSVEPRYKQLHPPIHCD